MGLIRRLNFALKSVLYPFCQENAISEQNFRSDTFHLMLPMLNQMQERLLTLLSADEVVFHMLPLMDEVALRLEEFEDLFFFFSPTVTVVDFADFRHTLQYQFLVFGLAHLSMHCKCEYAKQAFH